VTGEIAVYVLLALVAAIPPSVVSYLVLKRLTVLNNHIDSRIDNLIDAMRRSPRVEKAEKKPDEPDTVAPPKNKGGRPRKVRPVEAEKKG
jgi:hypothetical protein